MTHSGYTLAEHNKNVFNIEHPNKDCYCICGTSGGYYYTDSNNKKNIYDKQEITTCSYYTGTPCYNYKLKRKWSCCNKKIYGTLSDLLNLKCSK